MKNVSRLAAFAVAAMFSIGSVLPAQAEQARPLQLVVMDPLSAPLSCPCVEGYAQRKYEALAKHLEGKLKREVKVTFNCVVAEGVGSD